MSEVAARIEKARRRRFRPYPEYTDSGVEWLGELPAHWEVRRLKTTASVQLSNVDKHSEEGQVPVRLCNYVDVYYNDLITVDLEFMNATATPAQVRRFRLRAGDVVITKDSESWTDIAVPAVVGEDLSDVLCGYHLAHIKPGPGLDGRFLARQFSAIGTRDQFYVAANGITRFGLGGDAIRTGLFPIAPIEEQRTIAGFLDRETAKIDTLVARKERLIELLQEKRTALITRAVTRGLDPNFPVKDSGVTWLGKIPAHWDVNRLRATVTGCKNGVWGEEADEVHDVICVRVADFDRVQFRVVLDNPTMRSIDPKSAQTRRLEEEDLLLEKSGGGEKQPVGAVVMYDHSKPAVCSNFVARMPVAEGHHPRYLTYLHATLYAARINTRSIKQNTGIQNLDSESYLNESVGLPNGREQRAIADFLDRETARIDTLIAKVETAIRHQREFRTALISAAVTGKIDVREGAS